MKHQGTPKTFQRQSLRVLTRDSGLLTETYLMGSLDRPEKHSHRRTGRRMGFTAVAAKSQRR